MKIFQLGFFNFYNKSALLKTILLLLLFLFCFFNLSAQKESNIKLKIEAGFLSDLVKRRINYSRTFFGGAFLSGEFKLKTSKTTEIGLRIGASQNTQLIKIDNPNQFNINNNFDHRISRQGIDWNGIANNKVISFVPTFDYHFPIGKNFRPYLGLGVGYNFLATTKMGNVIGNPSDVLELSVNNQVGFLIRGGFGFRKFVVGRFDLSKLSFGLEYNFIPKADVKTTNGQIIGTLGNSYLGFSMGYTIGLKKSNL